MAGYVYLRLSPPRGLAARADFVERLKSGALPGAQPLGLFTAQLGWEASEAALLARRDETGPFSLTDPALATVSETLLLTPTLRPKQASALQPGGVWVHRRFDVMAGDVQNFIGLSAMAWADFEARFEASIFGLFLVDVPADAPERTLLLITRYASHGVWEDSRDPTTEAMQTFQKRAALTLRTSAASTLLIALG